MTTELDWDTLIQQIKDGECTPFIGAGTAFGVLPLAADLAEAILQEEETRSASGDRSYVFRAFEKLGLSSRVELVLYALGEPSRL